MEGGAEDAGRSVPAADPGLARGTKPRVKEGGGGSSAAGPGKRVEQMMARLQLTAAESTAVVVDDTEDLDLVDPDRAFVGKVLAPNKLHVQTISSALRPAWGNPKGLTFNPAGDNLFVAEFGSKADRDRVMEGSPWTVGRSGGLALFWRQPYSVSVRGFNSHCIDVVVNEEETEAWHATFVYGEPKRELRHIFWDLLRRLNHNRDGAWLCCGDFNEVLCFDEHVGVRDRTATQNELFRNCMEECGLSDMGFSGPKFTWCNRQDAQSNVRVRLDRAMCNSLFTTRFANCFVENVITTSSDHYAVALAFEKQTGLPHCMPVQVPFRYEAMWCRAEDYGTTVEQAWAAKSLGANPIHAAWEAMNHMACSLQKWSKASFGAVRRNIQRLERSLKVLPQSAICQEVLEKERDLERQLSRKKNNRIDSLVRDDGSKCDDPEGIKGMVHQFYEQLFTAEVIPSMEEVLEAIPAKAF
ncbi:hypothetical protein ACQ4PT_009451 [Festuca glaucescens]